MALDPALERIPGLAGYLAMDQYSRGQEGASLERGQTAARLQDHFRARDLETKARDALTALGPDATMEDRIKAIAPFSAPKDIMHYGGQQAIARSNLDERRYQNDLLAAGRTEALASREAQAAEARRSREDVAAQQIQARKEIAAAIQAGRQPRQEPAPSLTDIIDPKNPNRMIKVDTRVFNPDAYLAGNNQGIIGVAGKTPDAAKKDQAKESGKERFSNTVGELANVYGELEKMGAVVNPEQASWKNLWERASASDVGQKIAGAVGTKAQTQRDRVEALRAGLMANMKEATGMSAQSLNSNAELMFYMKMATSPTVSIAANKAALTYLDKTFGLGLGVNASPEAIQALKEKAPRQNSGRIGGNPTIPAILRDADAIVGIGNKP